MQSCVDGYCSTLQGLLDWFEVDLGFIELLFIQIDLCVVCDVCRHMQRVVLITCLEPSKSRYTHSLRVATHAINGRLQT